MKFSNIEAEELWKSVHQDSDFLQRRIHLIELAKILLDEAKPDETEIAELTGSENLTDIFLEYLNVAGNVTNFFDSSISHLEPELKESEFEVQLKQAHQNIFEIQGKYKKLRHSHEELLLKKESLFKEQDQLVQLQEELKHLQVLSEKLKPENINHLKEQIGTLKSETETKRPERERLEEQCAKLREIQNTTESMMTDLSKESEECIGTLYNHSRTLGELLDQNWEEYDVTLSKALRKLKQKNLMYEEITGKLDKCLENLKDVDSAEQANREIFTRHFTADSESFESIENNENTEKRPIPQNIQNVTQLSAKIKENLQQFDKELTAIIQAKEELNKKIRRLNKVA